MVQPITEKNLSEFIHPFFRKYLALFIVFIPVSMILIFSASVLYYGTPEFRVDKTQYGLRIGEIHQTLNPVQPGDMIIRINSFDYHQILSLLLSPDFFSKRQVRVVVLREGKTIEFEPQINPVLPFRFFSIAWPHLVLMFVLISLGVLSYLRITSDQPAFLFLITMSFFATIFSATFPSYFGTLEPHIISLSFFVLAIGNWLAFGACLHFVFSFPNERNIIKNRKWLIAMLYLTAPMISIAGSLMLADNAGEFWGWLQRIRNLALPFMAVTAFLKHVVDYRRLSSSLEKNQIKLIISAYWFSFGPYLLFYAVPNILFNEPFISFRLVVISGVILPGAYFLAMIQYRLLDVDKMIFRTVSYFLLISLLMVSYASLVIFLKRTFMGRQMFSEELFLIYVLATAILFEPVNRLITFVLNKIFLPKALYQYDMIISLSRSIGSSVSLDNLISILTQAVPKNFHVKFLRLVIFHNNAAVLYPEKQDLTGNEPNIELLKNYFSQKTDYLFCNALIQDIALKKQLRILHSQGIELIFALRGGTGLSGFLLLGRRKDEKPYTRRDVEFFTTVSNQAGLALENVLYHESLIESKNQIEKMFGKVVQSEKMAVLGEMSTTLAHELKNPLGIIRSSAQYLTKNFKNAETSQELLNYIIGEVDGLESVINNMMGLARYKTPELAPVDLYSKTTQMIDHWIQSDNHNKAVSIKVAPLKEPLTIFADFNQLQQVFLNCIVNAEDAMPNGGRVFISIAARADETIDIHIRDTGPGIPGEDLENVFKQFFTTKEKGMGIGLSVCKQIILAHNGQISLENMPQGGVRVMIHLPVKPLSTLEFSNPVEPLKKESLFV